LPAIAVTAYAGDRDRDAALAAGFQAHLPKPLDIEMLRSTVRRLAAPAADDSSGPNA
jgi:CheY-like chemotaxis protein